MSFPATVYIFLVIELFVVGWIDFKRRRIANIWSLTNLLVFFCCLLIFPQHYHLGVDTFFYPVVFFMVGFLLFILKIMGAGDSKYLFSLFFLIPIKFQDIFFFYLMYTTIIVGISLLIFNTLRNFDRIKNALVLKDLKPIREVYGSKFSYAPVIAVAWLWFGWSLRSLISF